ncbi:MAG TPA: hypothetical protein VJT82_04240, partial [Pyrinomonadaceae bacterium]|nr:hypothetical protein [Pyrinomonadaceae bacterium]
MKLPQLRTCTLSLLTLLVAAPASPSPHARMPATTRARTSAASTPNASQGQLRCTPRRLQRGDTLTLDMPAQHGGYLAVVNPRGKYFFLTS